MDLLNKDVDALEKSKAVRIRGFSLGHELFKAPPDIYDLLVEHVVTQESGRAGMCIFLSTCKIFARRRTQFLTENQNYWREFGQLAISHSMAKCEIYEENYADAVSELGEEAADEFYERGNVEKSILYGEKWGVKCNGVWG